MLRVCTDAGSKAAAAANKGAPQRNTGPYAIAVTPSSRVASSAAHVRSPRPSPRSAIQFVDGLPTP